MHDDDPHVMSETTPVAFLPPLRTWMSQRRQDMGVVNRGTAHQQQPPRCDAHYGPLPTAPPPGSFDHLVCGPPPPPPPLFVARIGPYDICELRVVSLHFLECDREAVRILGVAAGESLHNIYRVIMTSLGQREDRARLVFHAWVLPDGHVAGNGPRSREILKEIANDRELYLNELPLYVGYTLELVFGKCAYAVVVEDIFSGLTDEQDLIWTPRVCEGSYGEAVPFDLCYFPHLFRRPLGETCDIDALNPNPLRSPSPTKHHVEDRAHKSGSGSSGNCAENKDDEIQLIESPTTQRFRHLRPRRDRNYYLEPAELDEINSNLSKMRFIRQHSQIKPLLRKNRPEDYITNEEQRKRCFRMSPRRFFYHLWTQQMLKQSTRTVPPHACSLPMYLQPLYQNVVASPTEKSNLSGMTPKVPPGVPSGETTPLRGGSTSHATTPTEYLWEPQKKARRFIEQSTDDDDTANNDEDDEMEGAIKVNDDALTGHLPPPFYAATTAPPAAVLNEPYPRGLWNTQRAIGRAGHFFPRCRVSRRVESQEAPAAAACAIKENPPTTVSETHGSLPSPPPTLALSPSAPLLTTAWVTTSQSGSPFEDRLASSSASHLEGNLSCSLPF